MIYLYLNNTSNCIQAIYRESDPDNIVVKGCEEITVPDSFIYTKTVNGVTVELSATEVKESLTYADKRAAEYPAIELQLDTIFHQGIDAWKAQIQTVKDKYPKPEA